MLILCRSFLKNTSSSIDKILLLDDSHLLPLNQVIIPYVYQLLVHHGLTLQRRYGRWFIDIYHNANMHGLISEWRLIWTLMIQLAINMIILKPYLVSMMDTRDNLITNSFDDRYGKTYSWFEWTCARHSTWTSCSKSNYWYKSEKWQIGSCNTW